MHPDLQRLARRFLEFVHRETKLPMIVCDEKGTIVEAVERTRIGTQHAGAQRILRGEANEIFVTREEVARDPRMKEGCNAAILIEGRRVGTFGLAGPLEIAQPLVRIAGVVLASWVHELDQQTALRDAATEVVSGVESVSQRAQSASAESAAGVETMISASRDAAEKVRHTDTVVRTVQEIAQTSRILSINGSVEAARAGEGGRGFAVVAREMLELAERARGAANEIQTTLGDVQRAIEQLQEAIARSASLAQGQSSALADVNGVVESLRAAVLKLAQGAQPQGAARARPPAPPSGAAKAPQAPPPYLAPSRALTFATTSKASAT